MIRVVAHFRPKPGRLEEARQHLLSFTVPTRAEVGCVFYDLHENPADPEDLTFIEEWRSVEDLDAQGQSAHIQEGRKKLPELMDFVDVRRYRLLGYSQGMRGRDQVWIASQLAGTIRQPLGRIPLRSRRRS